MKRDYKSNRNWKEHFLCGDFKSGSFWLGGFRFFVGFLVCRFVFALCVQGEGRDFPPARKRLRANFLERGKLCKEDYAAVGRAEPRDGSFIFFSKNRFFSCMDC